MLAHLLEPGLEAEALLEPGEGGRLGRVSVFRRSI
jgi:hypothetical protein